MRRMNARPLVLLPLALMLAGCRSQLGDSPPETASTEPSRPAISAPELSTIPPSDEPVTGEVPQELMGSIVADAARRTGVGEDEVEVVQAISVTWNDGSLGCPEPGMSYTMALVDGYHVILAADDEEFDYRVSGQGGFKLCESGGRPSG